MTKIEKKEKNTALMIGLVQLVGFFTVFAKV